MLSIQTNVNSLIAQQNLNINNEFQSQTIQQLTSGYRINQSGDDAAGLAVANQYRSTVAELTQGVANGNDGQAQLQIMDGGMSNISQILDRLKTLATQSASGTFTGSRATLNDEFQNDVSEIDRQAQSIGLNTGGTFAQNLSVYLGEGSGSQSLTNGQVTLDLANATVDSQSLGLKGMQVVAGTADIGTGSAVHSVNQIVNNQSNATSIPGSTVFDFSGPGFSDSGKVAVAVNLSGVSDIDSLVTNINSAIASASSGTLPSAQALKSAGIVASVSTDANGGQELSFSSSTSAFQVQAGDQMANALMGNFSSGSTGTAVTSTVTGGNAAPGTTSFNPSALGVKVQIAGASMASPVTLTFNSSDTTAALAINDLTTQVSNNAALHAAGISVSGGSSGTPLVFTSATGETFSVQSTGDTQNVLGLGNLNTSALSSPAFYSSIAAGTTLATAATGSGLVNLGFSFDGGATGNSGPTIVGSALTTVNTTTGGIGATPLALTINGTSVTVDFSADPNKGSTESVANVVSYINSTVDSQMGWASGTNIASVNANNGITLLDTVANASSSMKVTASTTSLALGLTTGSTPVTNDVTAVTAQAAQITGLAVANASGQVNTSNITTALALNVNGTAVSVDFTKDANKGATESLANVANYINSSVNAAMGWGSDVKVATVTGAGATSQLVLTDPMANANSTLTVTADGTGTTNTSSSFVLGLSTTNGEVSTSTGTGAVGNTVTVNLAGGDATAASTTGTANLSTGVDTTGGLSANGANGTGGNSLSFSINGTGATALFANDTNASTGAAYTGGAISNVVTNSAATFTGGAITSPVNAASAATYSGANISSNINTQAAAATLVGSMIAGGAATAYGAATMTGTAISGDNVDASSLTQPLQMTVTNSDGTNISFGVTLSGTQNSSSDIAGDINAAWTAAGGTGTLASAASGMITLTSSGTGGAAEVEVNDGDTARAVGLTSSGNVTHNGTGLSNLQLSVTDAAGVAHNLNVHLTAGTDTPGQWATDINNAWTAAGGSGTIASNNSGVITLASLGTGVGSQVYVQDSTAAEALGLTTTANVTKNGTAALSSLVLSVTDTTNTAHQITVNLTGTSESASDIATQINTQWQALGGAHSSETIASGTVGGPLVLTSLGAGPNANVTVDDSTAAQALNLTTTPGQNISQNGGGVSPLVITATDAAGASHQITVNLTGTNDNATAIMNQINAQWQLLSGQSSNSIASLNGQALVLSSIGTGSNGTLTITDSTAAEALNLTTPGTSVTKNGSAFSALNLTVTDGQGNQKAVQVTAAQLAALGTGGQTAATLAGLINTAWQALYVSGTSGPTETGTIAAAVNGGTQIQLTSQGTGGSAQVYVQNSTAAQGLGLTSATLGQDVTTNGTSETAAQVAAFLNTTAQKALGASTATAYFTVNNSNELVLASQTKGADSNVTVTASAFSTALGLTANASTNKNVSGTAPTMTSVVNTLNQAFNANTALQQAGLQASSADGTHLTISSSNSTNFRIDEYGTNAGSDLGFGQTAGPFTGLTSGASKASMLDAGGTSAIGTSASSYLSFTPLKLGSDAQAVTLSANSTSGVLQSLTLTLKNDSTAQTGATIDSAVAYINSQLQQSNNATLRNIVAVKENAGGTEKINFLSSLPSFTVSVGSSANGNGINGGAAAKFSSQANGTASNIAIDTEAGATAAITAITNAVSKLGSAQAAVGKGENQLNYAVSLAQSQITNFSAAESQIRDADVASEAANLSKAQVLQQATIAAMAQANSAPQAVLSLLKG
jgi:flagellin